MHDASPFAALLRMELRRARPGVIRALAPAALLVVGVAYLEDFSPAGFGLGLLGVAMMFLLQPWMIAFAERVSGELEFLARLPVDPGVVGRARAAATALIVTPAAAAVTGGAMLAVLPALGTEPSPWTALGLFTLSWCGTASVALYMVGALTRFGAERILLAPLVVLVLATVVFDEVAGRIWDDPTAVLTTLLQTPWAPAVAAGAVLITSAVVGGVGFALFRTGLEEYEPDPDRR